MASVSLFSSASGPHAGRPLPTIRTRSTSRNPAAFFSRFCSRPHPRLKACAWLVLVLAALEGLVRLAEIGFGSSLSDAQRLEAAKLRPGSWVRGRYVNSWGYWDAEFDASPAPDGVRRVALLGDSTLLAGGATSNVASRLEQLLPGAEVDHFGIAAGGPREFAAQFPADVVRRRPQKVIVCLTMTPAVDTEPEPPQFAHWHTLHLVQALVGPSVAQADADAFTALDAAGAADYDEYVRRRAAVIDACRREVDDAPLRESQAAIARLADACERNDIPLTLVLVPGEFQMSPQLTASFSRRREVEAATLDLELPQRRWRAFGEHLGVEVVDLLPALRDSGELVYLPNSAQWNDRGVTLTAETIARGL